MDQSRVLRLWSLASAILQEERMRYFRRPSRIAWLGLAALLTACSGFPLLANHFDKETSGPQMALISEDAFVRLAPCEASLTPAFHLCADPNSLTRTATTLTLEGAYLPRLEPVRAKMHAWISPLDERRYVCWSRPQTSVRRERNQRQPNRALSQERDEQRRVPT
jgi:hypothetical protein